MDIKKMGGKVISTYSRVSNKNVATFINFGFFPGATLLFEGGTLKEILFASKTLSVELVQ